MPKALIAAALALAAPAAAYQPEQIPSRIDWTIAPSGDSGSQVQFGMSYRTGRSNSMNNRSVELATLRGLSRDQLLSDQGTQVRFVLARNAGRFDCEGIVRRQRGTGECRYAADPTFAAALSRHGIGAPTPVQQFSMAMHDVRLALVEELDRQSYAKPDAEGLVSAAIHGVSADYVRDMSGLGHNARTVASLVGMRIHGVSPDYVRELAAFNYHPDAETLVGLRIHGVSADFIREMRELGYRDLSTDDLVGLRIHGVRPEFVREMRELGYSSLSASDLTSMRIHGVSADFVRRANSRAGTRLSPGELVSRRIHNSI